MAGKVPVLVDGSFRRGTDILKALAFGAKAVAVGRPVMWGLAAYGADGVQGVIEMLQTELARYMAMCGRSTLGRAGSRQSCNCTAVPSTTIDVQRLVHGTNREALAAQSIAAQGARGARRPRGRIAARRVWRGRAAGSAAAEGSPPDCPDSTRW